MRRISLHKGIVGSLTLSLLVMGREAGAQFDKYKSKTNYDVQSPSDSRPPLDKTIVEEPKIKGQVSVKNALKGDGGKTLMEPDTIDAFGRKSSLGDDKLPEKDSKYVNLNPETAFGPEVVTSFDFPDTSLVELTKYMQKLTGINLILDKELKGKISIMAPTAITVGDAWKAYLTALNMNGYSLVKSGKFYKIVNARDIRYTPTKIYTGTYTPDTENYVMRILPLKNIDSTEVTRSFRPFMSRYGRIIEVKQTNTIIVQDTGSNINRLVRLIKLIDVPGHEETLQIIPVKYSSAQEIAKLLDTILKGKANANKRARTSAGKESAEENISKIIAEPRTNSIIAMANADGARQLRDLIKRLDVKVNRGSGQIHVYYLNHGDAETLAKTLSDLVSNAAPKGKGATRFTQPEGGENLFNAEVKITSDKDNNALVITASPTDYLTVKSVIDKLDIPRDQVYVEGMIMETNVNKGTGYGLTLVGAYGAGGAQKAGFTGGSGGTDLVNVLTNNITSLGGLFIGGGTGKNVSLNVGGSTVTIDSVSGLITAIANHSNTNVLATPQILALDNTEATFEVGESVPVQEQTIANNQTSISVRQQTAGLTLKITPQINKVTRFVKLQIDQKIEEFQASANTSASGGLATTSRAAVTTVVVRDKDTIAMGGLMRDQNIESTSKVPLLGDIPVLGWLFRNYSKNVRKVNLLFFLTPKIMDGYRAAGATVKDVLNRRSSFLKKEVGSSDPNAATVKGLFEKADKQMDGPLYDEDVNKKYRDTNEDVDGIGNEEVLLDEAYLPALTPKEGEVVLDTPNYKEIAQKVQIKRSGVQK